MGAKRESGVEERKREMKLKEFRFCNEKRAGSETDKRRKNAEEEEERRRRRKNAKAHA